MRVPAAIGKPLSGFAPTVSSRSPGLALMVSSAPVYVPTGTLTLPRISPSWSSCSRFTHGAGLGADHTVTALPPPCGTSAMLSSFTPIVAQSSEDASLIVSGMVPDIGVGVGAVEPEPPQPLTISDASSDDWATIGVKLLSIALVPQGGGSAVTVWSAPSPAPCVNLEQLDQLGEILGNVSVPVGTYTGALLTISANPGDLLLTVGANPESGFPIAAGTRIPSDQIQIQGRQGSSGNFTVPEDEGRVGEIKLQVERVVLTRGDG